MFISITSCYLVLLLYFSDSTAKTSSLKTESLALYIDLITAGFKKWFSGGETQLDQIHITWACTDAVVKHSWNLALPTSLESLISVVLSQYLKEWKTYLVKYS